MQQNRALDVDEVVVSIRSIAFGGAGVGEVILHHNQALLGISAFVPYTAVGEKVIAKIIENKQRYLKTELVEILDHSPMRVDPECRYFKSCGGCGIQHLSYPEQIRVKQEMLISAMRTARISISEIEKITEIIQTEPYHYRRRVSLHVSSEGKVGFYRSNSRSLVQIDSCHIATNEINQLLPSVQKFATAVAGKISSILLEQDQSGVIVILKSPYDLSAIEIEAILEQAKKYFSDCLLLVGENEVGGFGRQILELHFTNHNQAFISVPAGSFSQVNWSINKRLLEFVCAEAKIKSNDPVYDLYAGAGNFSIPLARAGADVVAVESEKRLVQLGKTSAKRLGLDKKLEFCQQTVEDFLHSKIKRKIGELIIADPPRNGLASLCAELNFANRMILISCSLPSFVRDLKNLIEKDWQLEKITAFDMFAQTSYLEIAAVFVKKTN